jgi:hypothetical protein
MNKTTIKMISSVLMVLPSLLKWVADVSTFAKYFDLSMEQTAIRMFPAHLPKIVSANASPTTK